MFIGHYGVALAAKKVAPKASLASLFFAAQFVDLLWPVFLLVGLEKVRIDPGNTVATPLDFYHYPYTHSLLGGLAFAFLVGTFYMRFTKYQMGAIVLGLLVVSHWFLDAIVHKPDLPLYPDSDILVGLGLWNIIVVSMVIELAIFSTGIIVYLRCSTATDNKGRYGFWALIGLLVVFWIAALFGPPPPDVTTLAISGLFLWLFIPWAIWIEKHRTERTKD